MSKPTKLSEIRVGDKVPSAAPLPALVQGTGRSPNLTGSVGALVSGGPSVGAVQLKSTTVAAATVTADQLVGGQIGFGNGGGAADITLPSVEELFQYLTRDWFQAASSPTSDVGATTALTLPSIPVQYFDCTFTTGTGSTPSLLFGDLEFYPDGPAAAVSGLTKILLPASSVNTFRFFPIQYSSTVAPRIGFFIQNQAANGAVGGATWAHVLAVGNVSGGTDPTITTGDQIQFAGGIAIGGNNTAATASDASGVAIGEGATSDAADSVAIGTGADNNGHINSVALGVGATNSNDNEIVLGTVTENVVVVGNLFLNGGLYDAGNPPTVAASGPGNLNSVAVNGLSTDTAGYVSGEATAVGAWQATVTFSAAYGGVGNVVILGPTNDNSFHAHLITINGGSSTTFVINGISPGNNAPWSVAYHVIGLL